VKLPLPQFNQFIRKIESNDPNIDTTILHTIEKAFQRCEELFFFKMIFATGDDMKSVFFEPPNQHVIDIEIM